MENKDGQLWQIALRRAAFKRHLIVYIVVNSFLWMVWLWDDVLMRSEGMRIETPWPIWPTLGWGIAIALNYYFAYAGNKQSMAEKEYEELIKK